VSELGMSFWICFDRFSNLISLAIAGECGIIFEKTIWIYAGVTVNAVFRL